MLEMKMAQQKQAGFDPVCFPVWWCFWIFMIFFMGAANIKAECEKSEDLKRWMQIYGIGPLALSLVFQCLATVAAKKDNVRLFKLSQYLRHYLDDLGLDNQSTVGRRTPTATARTASSPARWPWSG